MKRHTTCIKVPPSKTAVAIIVAIVLGFLFLLISPIILLSMEDNVLQEQLDNRYVNANYSDWHEESISNIGKVKLPDMWFLSQNEHTYRIANSEDIIIANGAVFGVLDAPYHTYKDFLQTIVGFDPEKVEFESDANFISINLSDFGILTVQCGAVQKSLYYLLLYSGTETQTLMVFSEDLELSYSDLLEVSEAISYSYFMMSIGKLPGIKGATAGRNSWSAVYKSGLTKLRNGTAARMSTKVIAKGLGSSIVGGFALDGYYGVKQHAYDRVKSLLS